MDETREEVIRLKRRQENPQEEYSENELIEQMRSRAVLVRIFFIALQNEGFSEDQALQIVARQQM